MEAAFALVGLLLLPILFCLSLLDIALRSVHYHRISASRHKNKDAEKLFSLLSSPERAISVLLFLRYTLTSVLFVIAGFLLYASDLRLPYKIIFAPVIVILLLILLEYLPRMLAVQNPAAVAFRLLKPFELVLKLNQYFPLPQISERLASAFLRLYGFNGQKIFSEYSVNEIKMFLSVGRSKGEVDLRRQTIDSKFMDFSDRRVREVMVPRPFVKSIEVNSSLRSIIKMIHENSFSRMPVYRDNFDNILGILHVKDIIGATEPFSLEPLLIKPFFVPESATVLAVFQNMQRNHSHIAIVVDEYGGVDGIVTLEDLIEQLIGEIHDEYDEEIPMFHKIAEGSWLLEGNLTIKDLNQKLNLDLPEDSSYTTVAGFLLSILDRIPSEKEEIRYGDRLFVIEKMMGNKISKVYLKLPQPKPDSKIL